jgi:hypothetical protein
VQEVVRALIVLPSHEAFDSLTCTKTRCLPPTLELSQKAEADAAISKAQAARRQADDAEAALADATRQLDAAKVERAAADARADEACKGAESAAAARATAAAEAAAAEVSAKDLASQIQVEGWGHCCGIATHAKITRRPGGLIVWTRSVRAGLLDICAHVLSPVSLPSSGAQGIAVGAGAGPCEQAGRTSGRK